MQKLLERKPLIKILKTIDVDPAIKSRLRIAGPSAGCRASPRNKVPSDNIRYTAKSYSLECTCSIGLSSGWKWATGSAIAPTLFRGCRLSPRKTVPHDRTDPLECVHASDNVRASRATRAAQKHGHLQSVGTGLEAWFPGKSDGPHSGGDQSGSWKILAIGPHPHGRALEIVSPTSESSDDRSCAHRACVSNTKPVFGKIKRYPYSVKRLTDWIVTFVRKKPVRSSISSCTSPRDKSDRNWLFAFRLSCNEVKRSANTFNYVCWEHVPIDIHIYTYISLVAVE